jgi:hypothetical protein
VRVIEQKFKSIPLQSTGYVKEKASYRGGENFIQDDSEEIKIGIFFESERWDPKQLILFNVIEKIIGSTSSFSTGGII